MSYQLCDMFLSPASPKTDKEPSKQISVTAEADGLSLLLLPQEGPASPAPHEGEPPPSPRPRHSVPATTDPTGVLPQLHRIIGSERLLQRQGPDDEDKNGTGISRQPAPTSAGHVRRP